jgi:tight adherence protein C
MNGFHRFGAMACIAVAAGALLLLLVRRLRAGMSRGRAHGVRLPLVFSLVAPVASLLEPLVSCLLPGRSARRTGRTLESLGLAPGISPERWHATGVAVATAFGATASLAGAPAWLSVLLGVAGCLHGGMWLRQQRELQQRAVARELPAWLDLMTVCVEAGATLTSGLRLIVAQAPSGPLRDYFERVLREIRGGRPRSQAFTYVADIYAIESLGTLATALAHAESSGMSLGDVLRAQAAQRTAERFARAEKLAMQAPVKMLGPLILCIFPCTFIVIGVPIAVRLKEALGA